MSGEYKGFRIWNLEFQVMTPGASNVVDDGNGRMHNSVTNAIYWDETDDGLRSHLLDFLNPMIDSSTNGVGWELDEKAYNKFYNIVQNNDPAYSAFITRNPNIWDAKSNPTGDKTIKLAPTEYVRVMCFKHILGYRAMIGLGLYAMDTFNRITQFISNTSYSIKLDPGFNKYHVYRNDPLTESFSSYSNGYSIGGLFMSMIPPENNSDIPSGMWNLEQNVYDEAFFVPTMSQIVPMIHATHNATNNSSYSTTYYTGCSWLKRGTSTQYSSSNAGMLNDTNCKLSLMLDSKATIWLSYKYESDQNTKYINPMIILGPIYKKKIYADDTLCTKNLGILCACMCGNSNQGYSTSHSANTLYNSAWCAGSSYYNYYPGSAPEDSFGSAMRIVGSFTSDASETLGYKPYTAYPACPSTVFTNFRYAKAAYTERGLIDEEVFRWINSSGLIKGQTYNDNQWIYLGSSYNFYAEDTYGNDRRYLYPSMRWDGEFNGTKTFA
jgi:hypothetical protein